MTMRDFETAQAEAMELLLQQCVESATSDLQGAYAMPCTHLHEPALCNQQSDSQTMRRLLPVNTSRQDAAHTATLMDLLAQSCEDASAMVQDMSYEDVAANLAQAIAATQESLRSVRENVGEILDDPDKMRVLCENLQSANHSTLLLDCDHSPAAGASRATSTDLIVAPPDEENVRNMMAFAENMCGVLDDALSTITQDELAITAQLSLGIAQRVLEAGQALFVSLGDDEREKLRSDQAERITIEELPADDDDNQRAVAARRRAAHRARSKQQHRLKHSAALRTYLAHLATKTRAQASEHPFRTGALTVVSLPFVGFAVRASVPTSLDLATED